MFSRRGRRSSRSSNGTFFQNVLGGDGFLTRTLAVVGLKTVVSFFLQSDFNESGHRRDIRSRFPLAATIPANVDAPGANGLAMVEGQLPGLGVYLMQTGYIWPILIVVLGAVILWRRGWFGGGDKRSFDDFSGSRSRDLMPEGDTAALTNLQEGPNNYQMVPAAPTPVTPVTPVTPQPPASMPAPAVTPGQGTPRATASPMQTQYYQPPQLALAAPPGYVLAPQGASVVTQQDFKNLLDKSRHDDMLAEGVASIKAAFTPNQPDLCSRLGVMTARKVIEIERMLVEELEESCMAKVGWLAGLFHTWRCEATIQRVGRKFEDEFDAHKGDWEKYLTDERQQHEEQRISAARKAAEQLARSRKAAELLLDRWAFGDEVGYQLALFRSWRDFALKQHLLGVQRQRVHTMVMMWTEGSQRGAIHICFKNWHQDAVRAKEVNAHKGELTKISESWNHFMDEESTKHRAELDAAMAALDLKKARAHEDVESVLMKWERGERHGLFTVVLFNWKDVAKRQATLRRRSQAVRQAVMQFTEGQARGSMHGCYSAWRNHTLHEGSLRKEHKRWEDLLNDERARREEDEMENKDTLEKRKEAAHRLVELTLRQWEMGSSKGMLSEMVTAWAEYTGKRCDKSRRREAVHASILRWAEGEAKGSLVNSFIHWKHFSQHHKLLHEHENQMKKQHADWETFLADQSKKHDEEKADMRTSAQKRHDEAHAIVNFTLAKWDLGEDYGMLAGIIRGWASWTREAQRVSNKRQAVHTALMQAIEGDKKANVHVCFLNWHMWTKHVLQAQLGEKHLADERSRWESYLENERQSHADALQLAMSEADIKKAKAHEATALMLNQWQRGDQVGLLATVLHCWRQVKNEVATMNWQKQSVHAAVTRFIEGDLKGAAHCMFLNWKHWAKTEVLYKEEVYERDRRIAQLEERTKSLLSKEQTRLLKYARIMGSCDEPMILLTCLASWRVHAGGMKSSEAQRQLAAELEEQRRLHELAVTKKRHLMTTSFEMMGVRNKGMSLLESFLTWCTAFQEQKQQRLHKLTHTKLVNQYAWYLQKAFSVQDKESLLAACFWELLREAKHCKHVREREEREMMLHQAHLTRQQLEDDMSNLRAQLESAYKQIDNMAETLKQELKTKEDLAGELREAYKTLRATNSRPAPKQEMPRPLSGSDVSGMPHLPERVLGMPGGTHPGLNRSLVDRD